MAEASPFLMTKRCAVVTGANKGIGFETCRQLSSKGIFVILTARDEKRGTEAVEKLRKSGGLSADNIAFRQLDVTCPTSAASLAEFLRSKFGKLDILVNNAGDSGGLPRVGADQAKKGPPGSVEFKEMFTQTYESSERSVQTNYYGVKNVTEALIPLLQLSDSARIVNVSSSSGQLKHIPGEWVKSILNDIDKLTEERLDELVTSFLRELKGGSHAAKGWPSYFPAYTVSKAAMNAYTRLIGKKYPSIVMNCLCPGYVKTDINLNTGYLSVEEGAESVVRLALLSKDGPSGVFFYRKEEASF